MIKLWGYFYVTNSLDAGGAAASYVLICGEKPCYQMKYIFFTQVKMNYIFELDMNTFFFIPLHIFIYYEGLFRDKEIVKYLHFYIEKDIVKKYFFQRWVSFHFILFLITFMFTCNNGTPVSLTFSFSLYLSLSLL